MTLSDLRPTSRRPFAFQGSALEMHRDFNYHLPLDLGVLDSLLQLYIAYYSPNRLRAQRNQSGANSLHKVVSRADLILDQIKTSGRHSFSKKHTSYTESDYGLCRDFIIYTLVDTRNSTKLPFCNATTLYRSITGQRRGLKRSNITYVWPGDIHRCKDIACQPYSVSFLARNG